MSFGFAIGDFIAVSTFAWQIYRSCKAASSEFEEVGREVIALHTCVKELEEEACSPDSLLNRAGVVRKPELERLLGNCMTVLQNLQRIVNQYRSLGSNHKRVWDRVKFGNEGLQDIREKLIFHTLSITLFLTSLGTGSLGRIEKKLNELVGEIRAGHREPSILTLGDEDVSEDDVLWRELKGDLAVDGITKQDVELHKLAIKDYLKRLMLNGDLEDLSLDQKREPASLPERLLIEKSSSSSANILAATIEDKESDSETQTITSGKRRQSEPSDESSPNLEHTAAECKSEERSKIQKEAPISSASDKSNVEPQSQSSSRRLSTTAASDESLYHSYTSFASSNGTETKSSSRNFNIEYPGVPYCNILSAEPNAPYYDISPEYRDLPQMRSTAKGDGKHGPHREVAKKPEKEAQPSSNNHVLIHEDGISNRLGKWIAVAEDTTKNIRQEAPRLRMRSTPTLYLKRSQQLSKEGEDKYSLEGSLPTTSLKHKSSRMHMRSASALFSKPSQRFYKDDEHRNLVTPSKTPDYVNSRPRRSRRSSNTSLKSRQDPASLRDGDKPPKETLLDRSVQSETKPKGLRNIEQKRSFSRNDKTAIKSMNTKVDISPRSTRAGTGMSNIKDEPITPTSNTGDMNKNSVSEPPGPEIRTVERQISLTLEQLFYGTKKRMMIRRNTFDDNSGKRKIEEKIVEVDVKPGCLAGTKLDYRIWGDLGKDGTQDLHFVINEKEHPLYSRNGSDLHHTLEVSVIESLTGIDRIIRTIDGKEARLHLAMGTPGRSDCFPGLGMPKSDKPDERGDMIVTLRVLYPEALSKEWKRELYAKLQMSEIFGG